MTDKYHCFDRLESVTCEYACKKMEYNLKLSFASWMIFIISMVFVLTCSIFLMKYIVKKVTKKEFHNQHIQCNMDYIFHHVTIHPDESLSVSIHPDESLSVSIHK